MQSNGDTWRPGQGRRLRVFILQRWGMDEALYHGVLSELTHMGLFVDDLSLAQGRADFGARESDPQLGAELAARIYAADVLIAPARRWAGQHDWAAWCIDLAALCYSVPVLLVDHDGDADRRNALTCGARAAGARCDVVRAQAFDIAAALSRLSQRNPHQSVPQDAVDVRHVYRGPHKGALSALMRMHPYRSAG
ncbi:MAG TPA: hypothetical protein VG943_03130 [Caulobacterales bacterium]|nr:hypothetical protein [Caulobacterales bacterium]